LLPRHTCFRVTLASASHLLPRHTCFRVTLASASHLLPRHTCFHVTLASASHLLPRHTCFRVTLASASHLLLPTMSDSEIGGGPAIKEQFSLTLTHKKPHSTGKQLPLSKNTQVENKTTQVTINLNSLSYVAKPTQKNARNRKFLSQRKPNPAGYPTS